MHVLNVAVVIIWVLNTQSDTKVYLWPTNIGIIFSKQGNKYEY